MERMEGKRLLCLCFSTVLTVLSPVHAQEECKTNGTISVCPGKYAVPSAPPLTPFTIKCNYGSIVGSGRTVLEVNLNIADRCSWDAVCSDHNLAYVSSNNSAFWGVRATAQVQQRMNKQVQNMVFTVNVHTPILSDVLSRYGCRIRSTRNQLQYMDFHIGKAVVLPHDIGAVTFAILPDKTTFSSTDLLEVRCSGVVGVKESLLVGSLVLQSFSPTLASWIPRMSQAVDSTNETGEVATTGLGTQLMQTLSQTYSVGDLLGSETGCQLSFRCFKTFPDLGSYLDKAQTKIVRVTRGCNSNVQSPVAPPQPTQPVPVVSTTSKPNIKDKLPEVSSGLVTILAVVAGALAVAAAIVCILCTVLRKRRRRRSSHAPTTRRSLVPSVQYMAAPPLYPSHPPLYPPHPPLYPSHPQLMQPVIVYPTASEQSSLWESDVTSDYDTTSHSYRH